MKLTTYFNALERAKRMCLEAEKYPAIYPLRIFDQCTHLRAGLIRRMERADMWIAGMTPADKLIAKLESEG